MTCGGADLIFRPRPLTAFSWGPQLSILGRQNVPPCTTCDAGALHRSTQDAPERPQHAAADLTKRL